MRYQLFRTESSGRSVLNLFHISWCFTRIQVRPRLLISLPSSHGRSASLCFRSTTPEERTCPFLLSGSALPELFLPFLPELVLAFLRQPFPSAGGQRFQVHRPDRSQHQSKFSPRLLLRSVLRCRLLDPLVPGCRNRIPPQHQRCQTSATAFRSGSFGFCSAEELLAACQRILLLLFVCSVDIIRHTKISFMNSPGFSKFIPRHIS